MLRSRRARQTSEIWLHFSSIVFLPSELLNLLQRWATESRILDPKVVQFRCEPLNFQLPNVTKSAQPAVGTENVDLRHRIELGRAIILQPFAHVKGGLTTLRQSCVTTALTY